VLDQPARLARPHVTLVRVDAGERDHDVGVLRAEFGHFLVRHSAHACGVFGVDRKDDAADLALAIIGGDLGHGRLARSVLEVFLLCIFKRAGFVVGRPVARHLGVGMHVDRQELVDVELGLVHGEPLLARGSTSHARAYSAQRSSTSEKMLVAEKGSSGFNRVLRLRGMNLPMATGCCASDGTPHSRTATTAGVVRVPVRGLL
jgi:hypothetical protein